MRHPAENVHRDGGRRDAAGGAGDGCVRHAIHGFQRFGLVRGDAVADAARRSGTERARLTRCGGWFKRLFP